MPPPWAEEQMGSKIAAEGTGGPPGRTRPKVLLGAFFVLSSLGGAVLVLLKLNYAGGDFANNLWGPAHYLVHGWSPYRAQEMLHSNPPVWFPPAIGLFFPVGWLDLRLA